MLIKVFAGQRACKKNFIVCHSFIIESQTLIACKALQTLNANWNPDPKQIACSVRKLMFNISVVSCKAGLLQIFPGVF